jgi:hypothetical protein
MSCSAMKKRKVLYEFKWDEGEREVLNELKLDEGKKGLA